MNGHGPKLGKLIEKNEVRDAIHIAVAPVTAGSRPHSKPYLGPGTPIKFVIAGNREVVERCEWHEAVGIVDPFLKENVAPGQHFWMFVMPNTITGLRHEWTHPAFDEDNRQGISEWWLRDFAERVCIDYDDMIAQLVQSNGSHATSGFDITRPSDEDLKQFWGHLEVVTGRSFERHNHPIEGPHQPFSCAC